MINGRIIKGESYKLNDLMQSQDVGRFIEPCTSGKMFQNMDEGKIFNRWKAHFRTLKIPFAVVKLNKAKSLHISLKH